MLILTRRVTESVRIGADITVVVLGVKGKQVRIGIDAPKDVPVHRESIRSSATTRPIPTGAERGPQPHTPDARNCSASPKRWARLAGHNRR